MIDQEIRVHYDNQHANVQNAKCAVIYSLIKPLSFKFVCTLLGQKSNSIFEILVRI